MAASSPAPRERSTRARPPSCLRISANSPGSVSVSGTRHPLQAMLAITGDSTRHLRCGRLASRLRTALLYPSDEPGRARGEIARAGADDHVPKRGHSSS